ncbi:MAG: cytochrome c [Rhodobacteraceae bacterium]|nr:cytochrome c [Paracoccaceae bacterium]
MPKKLMMGLFALILIGLGIIVLLLMRIPQKIDRENFTLNYTPLVQPDPTRGEVLYHLAGCGNCHLNRDPESPIFATLAGGTPLETNFGNFVPPNITPDKPTGIGAWSDIDFLNAMTRGVSPDGTHYYAAFPFTAYALMSTEDILDIKAYLFSLDPVSYQAPKTDLVFPFNFRINNFIWKAMFFSDDKFVPDETKSEEWNRGAYIVNSLGHCGSCHTPRNIFTVEKSDQLFQGAPSLIPSEKPAPRIAGLDRDTILNGLDEWAGAVNENSSMYLVTQAYSQYAPYSDLEAIATYLSSLPPN